jgi:hypothetical protein
MCRRFEEITARSRQSFKLYFSNRVSYWLATGDAPLAISSCAECCECETIRSAAGVAELADALDSKFSN